MRALVGSVGYFNLSDLSAGLMVIDRLRGLERPDGDCALASLVTAERDVDMRHGLVSSFGLDGHCCSVVLSRAG